MLEALLELILAPLLVLIEGFCTAFVAMLELVVIFLSILCEFIILALTQGIAAASEKYKERTKELADRKQPKQVDAEKGTSTDESQAATNQKTRAVVLSVVLGFVISCVLAWEISKDMQIQRVATTRTQVKKLADSFLKQMHGEEESSRTEVLPDRDAWKQPIELVVESKLLANIVVVRSSGPDGIFDSVDDISATRIVRRPVKQAGNELKNRAIDRLKDGLSRLLPGKKKDSRPVEENTESGSLSAD